MNLFERTKPSPGEIVAFYVLEAVSAFGAIGGACMIAFSIYVLWNGDLP